MNFFLKKSIWKKIVIILIFILIFEFIVTKPTLAEGKGYEIGGVLLSPIMAVIVGLGDGAMGIVHSAIMGISDPLIQIDMRINNLGNNRVCFCMDICCCNIYSACCNWNRRYIKCHSSRTCSWSIW